MFKKTVVFLSLLFPCLAALAQQLPAVSDSLVTDYTNTLSAGDKAQLESKLAAFNDSTSTQIAVVILKSVEGYDIDDYAQKLGRAWGIGQKGDNNGILILVALGDRKVSIQTGYGAEQAVPDATTHDIIKNDIVPRFKENDYYGGLNAATDDLMKLMSGKFHGAKKPVEEEHSYGGIIIVVIIAIIVLYLIFRRRGGGGGGQIYGGRGGASPFWWFLGGSLLGGAGGGWGGFSNGNGGFGGGSSGGDSSGGDFGGFGGGDFGGGGSSGSW